MSCFRAIQHLHEESLRPKGPEGRETPRMACMQLRASGGEVLDLSAGGCRVRLRGALPPPGSVVDLQLVSPLGRSLVRGEVVWQRKVGWRRHEAGVRFLKPSVQEARRLFRLMWNADGTAQSLLPQSA